MLSRDVASRTACNASKSEVPIQQTARTRITEAELSVSRLLPSETRQAACKVKYTWGKEEEPRIDAGKRHANVGQAR